MEAPEAQAEQPQEVRKEPKFAYGTWVVVHEGRIFSVEHSVDRSSNWVSYMEWDPSVQKLLPRHPVQIPQAVQLHMAANGIPWLHVLGSR
jgi:hypothetical protein